MKLKYYDAEAIIGVTMIVIGLLIWTGLLLFLGLTAGNIAYWALGIVSMVIYGALQIGFS